MYSLTELRPTLRAIWPLYLFVLTAGGIILGVWLYSYRGSYDPPDTSRVAFEEITLPSSEINELLEAPLIKKGVTLLDGAHANDFLEVEIESLLTKLVDRGHTIDLLGERRRGGGFASVDDDDRVVLLEEKLRRADSFIVIVPREAYTARESELVREFIGRGGKVLAIGDPTRSSAINSLSETMGVSFEDGYLYTWSSTTQTFKISS